MLDVPHNLDRKEIGRVLDLVTHRKSWVFQPIENLIGVYIVTPRNLRNRNTRNPRLRTDHTLLIIAPASALPPLRHTQNPVCVHLT